jgi:hypothetical protein
MLNRFEFQVGELHIVQAGEHYRIRAWPGPRALTSKDGKQWEYCWPEFRFINYPVHKITGKKAVKPIRQLELGLELPPERAAPTKTEAYDLLRQTIPFPFAMALAPFSSCQWNPLVFLHFNRDFLDLLTSSPAMAFYLANDRAVSSRIYKESKSFLPKLIGTKQVELLDYVGLGCTKQMVGIVKKIRPSSADMSNISELQTVRGNPGALKILSHLKSINAGVLALVGSGERILSHLTPMFLDEVSRDGCNHHAPAIFGQFSQCLRMHWEQHPKRRFPMMTSMEKLNQYFDELAKEQRRRNEIQRQAEMQREAEIQQRQAEIQQRQAEIQHRQDQVIRQNEDRRRKLLQLPFPSPPIPDGESIKALTCDADLYEEGGKQHNCVGNYSGTVRTGEVYLYRVLEPERATLSIICQRGQWFIGELKTACNQAAKSETFDSVRAWLDANQLGTTG